MGTGAHEDASELNYVDYGTAPVVQYDGVARVDVDGGTVSFALWRWVTTRIDNRLERRREVIQIVVTTIEGTQGAMDMTVEALGPTIAFGGSMPGAIKHFA